MTLVIGINAAHDASACLLRDGNVVCAITEERLRRAKYVEGYPHLAVAYCLAAGGLTGLHELDAIVLNQYSTQNFGDQLRHLDVIGDAQVIDFPSHHLLHAYYALSASSFGPGADILIVDGSGYSYGCHQRAQSPELGDRPEFDDMEEALSVYRVDETRRPRVIRKDWAQWHGEEPFYRFASLGHMYSAASNYIFGHWRHAGKTMGLAAYGDARGFPRRIVDLQPEGRVELDTTWVYDLPPRSALPPEQDPTCLALAARVQAELEEALLHIVRHLVAQGTRQLALSGGVGLNSVTNGRIVRETGVDAYFVTPAAGDAGVAIGAALLGHARTAGSGAPSWQRYHDYLGTTYPKAEIESVLTRHEDAVSWTAPRGAAPVKSAARELAAGQVVAWFEGASEFGPRALGHRSILSDPRRADMKDRLNTLVKFREAFRPYAACILAEHANVHFDMPVDDEFMLVVAPARASEDGSFPFPAVTHVDGTCRLQTVSADSPDTLRRLLEEFYAQTGCPLLLNTSLNIRGEPIVETPQQALECFLGSNIDVMYLSGYRVEKQRPDADARPALLPGIVLRHEIATRQGGLHTAAESVSRTGHASPLSAAEVSVLSMCDGHTDVAKIAEQLSVPADNCLEVLADCTRRGIIYWRKAGL